MTDTTNTTIESPTTDSEATETAQDATTVPARKLEGRASPKYGITTTCLPTILTMYNQGRTLQEIADVIGTDKSNIHKRLIEIHRGKDYVKNRADYLAIKQAQITESITTGDIEKAGLRDKVIAMGVLYDKERLERGLSASSVPASITINIVQASAEPVTIDITNDSNNDESANNA